MDKQFTFQGPQPKVTISLSEDGSVRTDWQQVNPVVFHGMMEVAKQAYADHCKMEQLQAAMKRN